MTPVYQADFYIENWRKVSSHKAARSASKKNTPKIPESSMHLTTRPGAKVPASMQRAMSRTYLGQLRGRISYISPKSTTLPYSLKTACARTMSLVIIDVFPEKSAFYNHEGIFVFTTL